MQSRIIFWVVIVGTFLVIVTFVGGYFLTRTSVDDKIAKAPAVLNQPVIVSSEASDITVSSSSRDGGDEVKNTSETVAVTPVMGTSQISSIATSSYSVYLGTAAKTDTSLTQYKEETAQVVTGYEWESFSGSPMFATLMIPIWNISDMQKKYEVSIWDGKTYKVLGRFASLEKITFPGNGVSRFKITGISPDLAICPGDRKFTWGVTFTTTGVLNAVRTPIIQDISAQGGVCRMTH